jgi:hypothetical protein
MVRGKETGDYMLPDNEKEELLRLAQEGVAEKKALSNQNMPTA